MRSSPRWLLLALSVGAACGSEDRTLSRAALLDPETCKDCHPAHFEEWQRSMHAYAADDPLFIAMNRRGQRETGGELGDFCVRCHAPMAVREGLTSDGLNLGELEQKYKGVTCYFCHNVDAVEGTHNNPLTLADDLSMRGGFGDAVRGGAHRAQYSSLHDGNHADSSSLCGACHDIMTERVHLERTFAEWKESVFSDPPLDLSCGQCHMNSQKDVVADFEGVSIRDRHAHDFPALDLALTDWPGQEELRAGILSELKTTVQSKLCYNPADNQLELFLTNIGAGHMWPSGAAQDRRAWVELVATRDEETLIESGSLAEDEAVALSSDPMLWQMRDFIYDENDEPAHMFWDVARIDSQLLPPTLTLDQSDPRFDHSVLREYDLGANPAPDRVTVAVHIRAMGLDVVDDLIESGDLEPAIRDRFETFTLEGSVLEWTPDRAGSDGCVP